MMRLLAVAVILLASASIAFGQAAGGGAPGPSSGGGSPTGAAGGSLSGTYPNPGLAALSGSGATALFSGLTGCATMGYVFTPQSGTCVAQSVTSVSNVDGTLTVSPTTGAVVASLNLANANIWAAPQTIGPLGTAISGTNFNSNFSDICASGYTGSASAQSCFTWQTTVVTGNNPFTSLVLGYSGSFSNDLVINPSTVFTNNVSGGGGNTLFWGGSNQFSVDQNGNVSATKFTGPIAGSETVASSSTPTFSTATRVSQNVLTANVTSFTLAAGANGQEKCLDFTQGSGPYTVAAPANVHGFFTVGTTNGKDNVQCFLYRSTGTAWVAESTGVVNE